MGACLLLLLLGTKAGEGQSERERERERERAPPNQRSYMLHRSYVIMPTSIDHMCRATIYIVLVYSANSRVSVATEVRDRWRNRRLRALSSIYTLPKGTHPPLTHHQNESAQVVSNVPPKLE
jgi:hypothetical protein